LAYRHWATNKGVYPAFQVHCETPVQIEGDGKYAAIENASKEEMANQALTFGPARRAPGECL
jgi:hypothetical protein